MDTTHAVGHGGDKPCADFITPTTLTTLKDTISALCFMCWSFILIAVGTTGQCFLEYVNNNAFSFLWEPISRNRTRKLPKKIIVGFERRHNLIRKFVMAIPNAVYWECYAIKLTDGGFLAKRQGYSWKMVFSRGGGKSLMCKSQASLKS